MKKMYALLVVLVMLFGLVAGAVGQTNKSNYSAIPFLEKYKDFKYKGDINALYLVCTTLAEYFPNSYAVWKPVMEKVGIHMDLVGPPEYSDASLISVLESALASGKYNIIVLYPITPQAITPLLDNIWKTYHVPVLSYAFSPDTKSGHYFLGTSYYTAGTVLGKSIIDYVNANADYFKTLKTIPVAIYMNPQGAEQYKRIQGAWDVLKKDGRFSLIKEYAANGEAACLTQTETLLTERPDVEVILTQIDNDVTGAYQAVVSGTYKRSKYLSLWGFDATGAVLNLMNKDGKTGVVQGSSFIDHYQSADALVELIPILVGAAKQGKFVQFDKADADWLGTALSNYYLTVTPSNVSKYFTPKKK
ncbi:MAG TPA: substrate-binding domain-containing protein [Rectinemataceae bacterium]|nr:substrate-binding domain-containing protein [Rectinemataceae bacterium]